MKNLISKIGALLVSGASIFHSSYTEGKSTPKYDNPYWINQRVSVMPFYVNPNLYPAPEPVPERILPAPLPEPIPKRRRFPSEDQKKVPAFRILHSTDPTVPDIILPSLPESQTPKTFK